MTTMFRHNVQQITGLFGSQSAMARALDLRQSTVWGWIAARRIPSWRIPQIIAAAARLDPPVHLRPDDFFDLPPAAPERPAPQPASVGP